MDQGGRALKPAFVAVSRFEVANGLSEAVKGAFSERPHLVDAASGFRRMEVLSPLENPAEIWLLTWMGSRRASTPGTQQPRVPRRAPRASRRGLKLRPQRTLVQFFASVAS